MRPELHDGEFVFCSVDSVDSLDVTPLLMFREEEGVTLILTKSDAQSIGVSHGTSWGWISLNVHSDLEAVGFLAEVSRALARAGISCNAVSAYYHDHIFVPFHERHRALDVLLVLSDSH